MNVQRQTIISTNLKRAVIFEIYTSNSFDHNKDVNLLLINDGQDLPQMNFIRTAKGLSDFNGMSQLVCVGIHAGQERKQEYGVTGIPDYLKRGSKAANYSDFVMHELIPALIKQLAICNSRKSTFWVSHLVD